MGQTGALNLEIPPHTTPIASKKHCFRCLQVSSRKCGRNESEVCMRLPLSAKFMIFRVLLLCVVISGDKPDPTASQGVREALS